MLLHSEEEDDSGIEVRDSNNPPGGNNETTDSRPHCRRGYKLDAHVDRKRDTGSEADTRELKFITLMARMGWPDCLATTAA
jgi:hypothetical protein